MVSWFAIGYMCVALVGGDGFCMVLKDDRAPDGYETAEQCLARNREFKDDLRANRPNFSSEIDEIEKVTTLCVAGEELRDRYLRGIKDFLRGKGPAPGSEA